MEKREHSAWIAIGVAIAIVLLLLWLTFAIAIDDTGNEEFSPIEQTGNP